MEVDALVGRARKKFNQLDDNNDGRLDGDELLGLAAWVWGSFHPGEEIGDDVRGTEAAKLLRRKSCTRLVWARERRRRTEV